VFSPSTTRVCPALLPPWKRTTTSASAARRSTIFPFPSSPHWVPVTTAAGTERLQPQHVGRDDLRELPQLRHHLRRHGIVDVDQGDRHAPDPLAAASPLTSTVTSSGGSGRSWPASAPSFSASSR